MFTFRHRCPECGERFAVRILEGDLTSCPKCNAVVPAVPEPCDEHWWTWIKDQWWSKPVWALQAHSAPVSQEATVKPSPKARRTIADAGVPL